MCNDKFGAGKVIRTRVRELGKVVLYDLSYSRLSSHTLEWYWTHSLLTCWQFQLSQRAGYSNELAFRVKHLVRTHVIPNVPGAGYGVAANCLTRRESPPLSTGKQNTTRRPLRDRSCLAAARAGNRGMSQ